MSATCGLLSPLPFATYDPASSCWRTCQGTLPWASTRWSATWPAQGTTRRGAAYAPPMWARAIGETGCSSSPGLLPTPTSSQPGGTGQQMLDRKARMPDGADRTTVTDLRMVLELLPTPEASDGTGGRTSTELGGSRPSGSKRAVTLATAVDHLLPTPIGTDAAGTASHDGTTLLDAIWLLEDSVPTRRPSSDGPPSWVEQRLPL